MKRMYVKQADYAKIFLSEKRGVRQNKNLAQSKLNLSGIKGDRRDERKLQTSLLVSLSLAGRSAAGRTLPASSAGSVTDAGSGWTGERALLNYSKLDPQNAV
jgi:hypothetical protein